MEKIVKTRESSPLSRLPDEIILQILNKVIDLKSLCFCYLVSRRFSSIVLEVDAISFATPLLNPPMPDNSTFSDVAPSKPLPFQSAVRFLYKFKGVKSLCVEVQSSIQIGYNNPCSVKGKANPSSVKWKAEFGNRMEAVFILWPESISDRDVSHVNGNGEEEEDMDLSSHLRTQIDGMALCCMKDVFAYYCLMDVIVKHTMLVYLIKDLPMLEEVSVTDSERMGRLSLSGGKLAEVKQWILSASKSLGSEMKFREVPTSVTHYYVPFLEMPVSGYVMKKVSLFVMGMNDLEIGNDSLMISEDGFEDKEEATYTEAVMEILKKHKDKMQRLM